GPCADPPPRCSRAESPGSALMCALSGRTRGRARPLKARTHDDRSHPREFSPKLTLRGSRAESRARRQWAPCKGALKRSWLRENGSAATGRSPYALFMPVRLYALLTWTTLRRLPLIHAGAAAFLRRVLPAIARRHGTRVVDLGIVRNHV